MPNMFRFNFPPFNRLNPAEREQFSAALDLGYFAAGDVLIEAGEEPLHLYILIKGLVQERRNDETVCLYGPDDNFDADALMQERSVSRFVAEEDVVTYLLPRKMLHTLMRKNIALASYYSQSLTDKLSAQAAEQNRFAMAPLLAAPLRETYLHPVILLPADTPLTDAAQIMRDKLASTLLIDLAPGLGMVTSSRLRDAVLIDRRPISTPVGAIAVRDPLSVQIGDALSQVMLLMVERQIKRVVVLDGSDPVGVLDVTDLFSLLSNHSYLAFIQLARATRVEELQAVAAQLPELIRTLHHNGTRVPHITRLLAEVNRRLYARLFELLAPAAVQDNTCLVLMGSEGREEQILRTSLNNALIVRDDFDLTGVRSFAREFSAALRTFGFTSGADRFVVDNPDWARSQSEFSRDLSGWVRSGEADAMHKLAALQDATAVAGSRDLLRDLQQHLAVACTGHGAVYRHFAALVKAFETPLGLFQRLIVESGEHSGELDIDKGGLFPIMHGARCLSLQYQVPHSNTSRRLQVLSDIGVLDLRFAADLIDAYEFMLGLRLKANLAGLADPGASHAAAANFVHADSLSKFETDLLKDSLQLVKEFKTLISKHFDLE